MQFRIIALALSAALSAGCAPNYHYRHPDPAKTAQDFMRDKYDCEAYAHQKAAAFAIDGTTAMLGINGDIDRCLREKYGYVRSGPETTAAVQEDSARAGGGAP